MFSCLAKTCVLAAAVSFILPGASALAAPWIVSSTGTISAGNDGAGLFGAVNSDLTGLRFSLSAIVDPEGFQYNFDNATRVQRSGNQSNPMTINVTVNGISKTFNPEPGPWSWGHSVVTLMPEYSGIYQSLSGYSGNTRAHAIQRTGMTGSALLNSLDFNQNFTYAPTPGNDPLAYFGFSVNDILSTTFESANLTSYSVKPAAAEVPEPAPIGMLGIGLIALAFARRKFA